MDQPKSPEILPFCVIGDHGQVRYSGRSWTRPPDSEGLILDMEAPAGRHWWDGTQFRAVGTQPSPTHVWDWPSHAWIDGATVDGWKATKWQQVKAARDAAAAAGVDVPPFGRFDADDAAASAVMRVFASLDAQPDGWQIAWTMFNNSSISLDRDQFRIVAQAILGHAPAMHAIGRALRDRIDAATLIGELLPIRWPA